jgi:hypothetical protein
MVAAVAFPTPSDDQRRQSEHSMPVRTTPRYETDQLLNYQGGRHDRRVVQQPTTAVNQSTTDRFGETSAFDC